MTEEEKRVLQAQVNHAYASISEAIANLVALRDSFIPSAEFKKQQRSKKQKFINEYRKYPVQKS